jgi:hypothetical protein
VSAADCALIAEYGVPCELTLDQSPVTAAAAGVVGFKVLILVAPPGC